MAAARGLTFAYRHALGGFQLDAAGSAGLDGVTGLFGASGAGKTSLLRAIAGLARPEHAHLVVGDDVIDDAASGRRTAIHERGIAYVFQEPRLFPHLDVESNLRYGARRTQGVPARLFAAVVERLDLGPLLARKPAGLSGGEAQRVAFGRALLRSPKLLLMDEPVAALDVARKGEVLACVRELQAETGIPVLYVSHQLDEVCQLCDQLLVIADGRIAASGDLQSVLLRTDLPELGGTEAGAMLSATCVAYDPADDLSELALGDARLLVPGRLGQGAPVRLRVRASDVSVSRDTDDRGSSILNRLPATLAAIRDDSPHSVLLELRIASGATLLARITRRSLARLALTCGDSLIAQIKSVSVRGAQELS